MTNVFVMTATKKYRVIKSGSQFDEGHIFETDTDNLIGAFAPGIGNPEFRVLVPWEFLEEVKEPESILETAMRITKGDRQNAYGPPDQDFVRIAKMWSAIKGVEFEPREVALFMILVKVSRETHQRKLDNWVDIAGYAHCGSICQK